MGVLKFVRDKNGNVMGSKKTDEPTGVTTVYDRQGNVLGRGYAKRDLTRDKAGNVLRWGTSDPSFLLK